MVSEESICSEAEATGVLLPEVSLEESLLVAVSDELSRLREAVNNPGIDVSQNRETVTVITAGLFQLFGFHDFGDMSQDARSELLQLQEVFWGLIDPLDWLYCNKASSDTKK